MTPPKPPQPAGAIEVLYDLGATSTQLRVIEQAVALWFTAEDLAIPMSRDDLRAAIGTAILVYVEECRKAQQAASE